MHPLVSRKMWQDSLGAELLQALGHLSVVSGILEMNLDVLRMAALLPLPNATRRAVLAPGNFESKLRSLRTMIGDDFAEDESLKSDVKTWADTAKMFMDERNDIFHSSWGRTTSADGTAVPVQFRLGRLGEREPLTAWDVDAAAARGMTAAEESLELGKRIRAIAGSDTFGPPDNTPDGWQRL